MVFIDIDGKEKDVKDIGLSPRDFTELEAEAQQHAAEAQAKDAARYEGIAPADSTGQALHGQAHRELLDTAQTLRSLSAYFSQINNSFRSEEEGDELDEELRNYINNGFGFGEYTKKLYGTVDLLDRIAAALEEYANWNTKVNSAKKERTVALEADQYIRIKAMLDQCVENLSGCLIYAESNSVMFRNLYAQIVNTTVRLEDMADGHLILPLSSDKKDAYGRTIHKISLSDALLDIESKSLNEYARDLRKETGVSPDRYFIKVPDMPLFPHEPNEEDLSQGSLGNCYMLASLAAVVRSDPARIKEHIRDNKDGTVTVLFYNSNKEPLYVTVEKSIPAMETMGTPFSDGPLWVKLLEKAYAASGLRQREERTFYNSYKEIESGEEKSFLKDFLGPEAAAENLMDNSEIIYSDTTGSDYSAEELETFNLVKNSIERGDVVTAGTRSPEKYNEIISRMEDPFPQAGADGKEDTGRRFAGINRRHAYTVLGVEEKNGQKYIRVRNPHNSAGLRFDENDQLVADKNMQGEAYVELRNFRMLFRNVTTARVQMSPVDRVNIPQAQQFVSNYGDQLREMIRSVKATENLFNWEFNDSPQFRSLDSSARQLSAALDANPPLMTPISKFYEEFVANARNYFRYRTEPLTDADALARRARNERTTRSRNRLAATESILRFADNLEQARAQAMPAPEKPDLQAQMNRVRPAGQQKYPWLTMDVLRERAAQQKAILQEEDFSQVSSEDLNKTVKQFANQRFKELRHILCEGDPEENEAINTALLEARSYILAGHSAEDLQRTELAENPLIAAYAELITQAVTEDQAQREQDMADAEAVIRQQRLDFHYAPAAQVPAREQPQQEQPAAQPSYEEKELSHWDTLDKKYGIPNYYGDERRDSLAMAAHTKAAERPARKELSLRAARLSGQQTDRLYNARLATEKMIQLKYTNGKALRAMRHFIKDHEAFLDAFIRYELTPEASSKNAALIYALAAGTPEQKAQALKDRMAELQQQAADCPLEEALFEPEQTLRQMTLHADKMLPVRMMDKFLSTADGQHLGVSLDEISAFKAAVKPALEKFSPYYHGLAQIKDPIYQYINRKAASKSLQDCGDKLAEKLKQFDDALKAKEALPPGRKTNKQIAEIKNNIKITLASILAVAATDTNMRRKGIRDIAQAEYMLSDYGLNKKVVDIKKSEGFKALADEMKYDALIRTEEGGKITLNKQAAKKLVTLCDAFEKAAFMNKKLEEDQKTLEEAKAAKQANAGDGIAPSVPGIH